MPKNDGEIVHDFIDVHLLGDHNRVAFVLLFFLLLLLVHGLESDIGRVLISRAASRDGN